MSSERLQKLLSFDWSQDRWLVIDGLAFCLFAITVLSLIRRKFKNPWANIPGPPLPSSWWKGHFFQINDAFGFDFHRKIAEDYEGVIKLNSLFGDQLLYFTDTLALQHIVAKDAYVFERSQLTRLTNETLFGTSLLSTRGDHHRKQRRAMSTVFSTGNLKMLVPVFEPLSKQFSSRLAGLADSSASGTVEIDILVWMSRAALEYIGQGGLGVTFDSLDESKEHVYAGAVRHFRALAAKLILPTQFLPILVKMGPTWIRRKIIDYLPFEAVQGMNKLINVMWETSCRIYDNKKESIRAGDETIIQKQIGQGKDVISALFKSNEAALEEDKLAESEILGQMTAFIFAGHDTTSRALSQILYQLSLRQDVQDRLRQEIRDARKNTENISFDTLMGLPYLDAVVKETLRVHPPLNWLYRIANEDIAVPLAKPIAGNDGKMISSILIPKNARVAVSILNPNRSKAIWGEDAAEWRPERWLEAPSKKVDDQLPLPSVYYNMLTFLGGSWSCIGFKFAEIEMKMVLSSMLEQLRFEPSVDIEWVMGGPHGLINPVIKGSGTHDFKLPLNISRAA